MGGLRMMMTLWSWTQWLLELTRWQHIAHLCIWECCPLYHYEIHFYENKKKPQFFWCMHSRGAVLLRMSSGAAWARHRLFQFKAHIEEEILNIMYLHHFAGCAAWHKCWEGVSQCFSLAVKHLDVSLVRRVAWSSATCTGAGTISSMGKHSWHRMTDLELRPPWGSSSCNWKTHISASNGLNPQRAADELFGFPRKQNHCSPLLSLVTLLISNCSRRSHQEIPNIALPEKQSQFGSILQSQSDGAPAIIEISPLVVTCCIRLIFLSSVSAM